MMIACISTHCNLTGDGAKTFIILLSALLQQLEKLYKGNVQGREERKAKYNGLKQVSQFLMAIQMHILDHIMTQDLQKHFLSVFSVCDTEIRRSTVESVLEAYFCGKVGNNSQKFLAQLSCSFYFKATAGNNRSEALCLVDECFAELHTAVIGLPVSSSRILDGLVLHRDFAVYCPADGDKRVLIVTEPIHSALFDLGAEVVITTDGHYQASEMWVTKRTEAIIKHMQDNNIKVLLSSVKQHDTVHYCAKNSGISIVECLSPEEISLICRITGILPFRPSLDSIHSLITKFAVAKFCQPLRLGPRKYVHIGLTKTHALQLHCVTLCGLVQGITEQCAHAFHGAFKMLRQMFTPVCLTQGCDLKPENQHLSKAVCNSQQCSAAQQHFVKKEHTNSSDKQLRPCGADTEKHSEVSPSVIGKEAACLHIPLSKALGIARSCSDLQHDAGCRVLNDSENNLVDLQKLSLKYTHPKETLGMDENELLENDWPVYTTVEKSATSRHVSEQLQPSKDICTGQGHGAPLTYKESNKSNIQSNSCYSIKEGSVVPVGGIFEILLHYYLSYFAKQCHSANISIFCTLIADVLLIVPETLCRMQKRNTFPQLYLKVTGALENSQELVANQKILESVTCKYQLMVSVLQCAARLLSIDLIIGVKRLPQKAEDSDSDSEVDL